MTGSKIGFSSGFTIIEVALVLAIAGLIFLVVFLALPALQNSQADNARRQAVGQMVSKVDDFLSNNQGFWTTTPAAGGSYPWNAASSYFSGIKLPNNMTVNYDTWSTPVLPKASETNVEFIMGGLCGKDMSSTASVSGVFDTINGDSNTQSDKTVNNAISTAVATRLSSGNYYCQDI